jgi:two-component system phosphate regulon sensor histidine kinase PhoR
LIQTAPGSRDLDFCKFVIRSLPTAVITVNADLRITGFNPWAEKITGRTLDEAMGHYCGDVLKGGRCRSQCPLRTVLNGQKPVSLIETTIQNKWGESIPVRMSTAGLFDDEGRLIGGVESFQDISRLKMLEREKDNIISTFAHDMKSSLAVIGGFVFRIINGHGNIAEDKQKKYLEIVKNESGRLESLINDFLEFSRFQSGRLKLNLSPTSLDRLLIEILDAYGVRASQSGIRLEFQSEEAIPLIEADANQLRRVFGNLLDNSLKFSKQNTTITVSARETSNEIAIEVKDQGIGISPDELPYIFDAFHRGGHVSEKKGFGLGLAGVKTILEAHGGRVRVNSEIGKGTVFTVLLPKS